MFSYKVDVDADMLAPKWLTDRINYTSIKFIYWITDGFSVLKGVKIYDQKAFIGDTILFNGKDLSVERR